MKTNLFIHAACLAFFAGAAFAQEPLITHERFVGTKSGIEKLTPEQRSRFDAEKARLLAEIGRDSEGNLIASAKDEAPTRTEKLATKSDEQVQATNDAVEEVAAKPAQTVRESSILGAPVQKAKQSPVQY